MRHLHILLSLVVLLVPLAGCGSNLRVASIQLGRGINADGTVAGHTTTFKPDETVYAAVITAGAGNGTVGVKWMYEGRVVGEPTKKVRGAAATEFHLQNAGGFPPGDYSVEAFLDGQPAGTRTFRVEN